MDDFFKPHNVTINKLDLILNKLTMTLVLCLLKNE